METCVTEMLKTLHYISSYDVIERVPVAEKRNGSFIFYLLTGYLLFKKEHEMCITLHHNLIAFQLCVKCFTA